MDGVDDRAGDQHPPSCKQLMAAIRKHCDLKGYQGLQRMQFIREYKKLVMERLNIKL